MAQIVKRLHLPDDWQAQIAEIANHPAERDKAEQQQQTLEGRLARLADLYEMGDLERDQYIKRRAEIQTALASLDIPEEPAIVQAGEYLESLAGLWDSLTRKEQREVLHIIFADILLDVGEAKVIAVKPNRDFVPLFRFDGMEEREDGYFYIARTEAAL